MSKPFLPIASFWTICVACVVLGFVRGSSGQAKPPDATGPAAKDDVALRYLDLLDAREALNLRREVMGRAGGQRMSGRAVFLVDNPGGFEASGGRPTTRPVELQGTLTVDLQPTAVELWRGQPDKNAWAVADAVRTNVLYQDLKDWNFGSTTETDRDTAYLGVGVETPGDALRSQLSLPPDAGLLVAYVNAKGPSNSVLRKHDVLQKLDDQLLINAEQLVALVRMHKPGDQVTLTFIRQASPRSERVTLGHKEPTVSQVEFGDQGAQLLEHFALGGDAMAAHPISFNDGEVTAIIDAGGNLFVTDAKTGAVLYNGQASTPEQWANVPEIVRHKLAAWKKLVAPEHEAPTTTTDHEKH
jgi:hypothetical protein